MSSSDKDEVENIIEDTNIAATDSEYGAAENEATGGK